MDHQLEFNAFDLIDDLATALAHFQDLEAMIFYQIKTFVDSLFVVSCEVVSSSKDNPVVVLDIERFSPTQDLLLHIYLCQLIIVKSVAIGDDIPLLRRKMVYLFDIDPTNERSISKFSLKLPKSFVKISM